MNTLARIQQYLAPPVFADEEQSRTARLLNIISLATLTGLVLYTLVVLVVAPAQTRNLPVLALAMLTVLGVQGLMRRGYVRLAGWLLSAGVWDILTLAAIAAGGVRAPACRHHLRRHQDERFARDAPNARRPPGRVARLRRWWRRSWN